MVIRGGMMLLVGCLVALAADLEALGGPKVLVGKQFAATQQVAIDQVDHTLWDQLLGKYVDESGRVDYRSWKAATADTAKLDQYLQALSKADPRRSHSRPPRSGSC